MMQKIYTRNHLLYVYLFINSLIYTILFSLILWHSLILIKVLIMRCIILFLHKHRFFHGIFYFLSWVYVMYQGFILGSGDEDLNTGPEDQDKKKEEGPTTTEYIIIGVFVGVIGVWAGYKMLDHYYPEALSAIRNAVVATGLVLIEKVTGMFPLIPEAYSPEPAEIGFKKSSLNWEAAKENAPNPEAFIAISRAENAFELLRLMNMKPEDYHNTLKLLRAHNVPSKHFYDPKDLYADITKVLSSGDDHPIYTFGLSNIDLMFYDTMLSINPSKLRD